MQSATAFDYPKGSLIAATTPEGSFALKVKPGPIAEQARETGAYVCQAYAFARAAAKAYAGVG